MHHSFNLYWDIFDLTAFLVKEDGSLDLDSVPVPVDWTGTFDFVALVHDEGEGEGGRGRMGGWFIKSCQPRRLFCNPVINWRKESSSLFTTSKRE